MLEKTEMKSENRYHRLYPLHTKEHCFACLCLYNGKQLDSWKNLFGEHIFSSVQLLSRIQLFVPHALQQARLPCPSPRPGIYPNSCPLSRWCHPTISFSVIPFSSCPQSFPASGSFPMSRLLASGSQSIGVSASTSVLAMNTQDWSLLGWTGWIFLESNGLSRVFFNITV